MATNPEELNEEQQEGQGDMGENSQEMARLEKGTEAENTREQNAEEAQEMDEDSQEHHRLEKEVPKETRTDISQNTDEESRILQQLNTQIEALGARVDDQIDAWLDESSIFPGRKRKKLKKILDKYKEDYKALQDEADKRILRSRYTEK